MHSALLLEGLVAYTLPGVTKVRCFAMSSANGCEDWLLFRGLINDVGRHIQKTGIQVVLNA